MNNLFLHHQVQQQKKKLFINLKNKFTMGIAPDKVVSFEDMQEQEEVVVPTAEVIDAEVPEAQ